jgi:methionyl-tRNA formyltransferase
MKIVFFGTPNYVLPVLNALHKEFGGTRGKSPIVAVVTQKPRPVGRKQLLSFSAVDTWAHKRDIPIYFDAQKLIKDKVEADLGIIASYGELLPGRIANYFRYGILVVHPSLLPQFRWGSPIPAALVTGTNPTGITIIKMDKEFDHGPIITQSEEQILPDDTAQTLKERLFEKSAKILVELIPPYLAGKIKFKPQDDTKATYARILSKEDAFIPPEYLGATLKGQSLHVKWEIPFIKIRNRSGSIVPYNLQPTTNNLDSFIRAMSPWPGAWSFVSLTDYRLQTTARKRIKILKAHVEEKEVISHKLSVLCLDEVQLEGKNTVSWKQFKEAYPKTTFEA